MPRQQRQALDAYIGQRLRLRRLMLGLSQEALGATLDLTFQQVQKYEKGASRVSASRLFQLAQVLDVPIQYFYDGIEEADGNAGLEEGSATDEYMRKYEGLREDGAPIGDMSPYLEFVSSTEGVQLNQALLTINDNDLRRQIVGVVTEIARVSGKI